MVRESNGVFRRSWFRRHGNEGAAACVLRSMATMQQRDAPGQRRGEQVAAAGGKTLALRKHHLLSLPAHVSCCVRR